MCRNLIRQAPQGQLRSSAESDSNAVSLWENIVAVLTFILGLAGSGKSHLAKEIITESGAEFFESLHGNKEYPKLV
jgi:excinuclease UvrABC ATPase subunit